MHKRKLLVGSALGAVLSAIGVWLRVSIFEILWPRGGVPVGSAREIPLRVYDDLGLGLMALGLALVLVTLVGWLLSSADG